MKYRSAAAAGNVIQRFTDYKKFNAESKIVAIDQH